MIFLAQDYKINIRLYALYYLMFVQHLQDMDEKRIARLAEFIRMCGDTEKNVMPILHTCIDGIHRSAEKIDPSRVSTPQPPLPPIINSILGTSHVASLPQLGGLPACVRYIFGRTPL